MQTQDNSSNNQTLHPGHEPHSAHCPLFTSLHQLTSIPSRPSACYPSACRDSRRGRSPKHRVLRPQSLPLMGGTVGDFWIAVGGVRPRTSHEHGRRLLRSCRCLTILRARKASASPTSSQREMAKASREEWRQACGAKQGRLSTKTEDVCGRPRRTR